MDELKTVLDLMPDAKTSLGHAALARMRSLKAIRKKLTSSGLDPAQVDEELELLRGTKERKGLFHALDVQEEQKKGGKEEEKPLDQRDIEDEADYRTWDLTTETVRELVTAEVSARPPVEAVRILNALEDGENQRDPRPRESVLEVIRGARRPLVKQVDSLKVVN